MEPGCQMDSALVVRGAQGVGKTSLLRALFGEHFVTLHSHQKDEEQKRMLGCAWGVELGELEGIAVATTVKTQVSIHIPLRPVNNQTRSCSDEYDF